MSTKNVNIYPNDFSSAPESGKLISTFDSAIKAVEINARDTALKQTYKARITGQDIISVLGQMSKQKFFRLPLDKVGNNLIDPTIPPDTPLPPIEPPSTVTIISVGGEDNIVSGLVGDNTVVGTTLPGSGNVSIRFGNTSLGNATVNAQGGFTYTLTPDNLSIIGQGINKAITIAQTDIIGNTSISSPFVFAVDTIAPTVTITSIGGSSSIVNGVAGSNAVIGTAEAGSGDVSIRFGSIILGTTQVNAQGNFTYTLTTPNITTLGQGQGKTITASQTDAVGNTGTSQAFTFEVNTIAPTVTITSIGGSDSIVSGAVGDNTVVGTAEPNISVTVRFGSTILGTTTVNSQRSFVYTLSASNLATIGEGANKAITVSQTSGGNTGTSPVFIFQVRTIAPTVTITSIGGSDSIVSSIIGDNTITGTANPNSGNVTIRSGNTGLGVTGVTAQGTFTYNLTTANITTIGQGEGKVITASQTDAVGNIGTSAPFPFSIYTIVPNVTISSIGGSDSIVSDAPGDKLVVGTAEPSSGNVTIRFGSTILGTTTVNTQGTFTYSLTTANITTIGQGSGKSITASQTDAIGNTGTSPGFSFTVSTIAPTVTISSIGGSDSIVSGAAGDKLVVGTAEPSSGNVTIRFGSTILGTTTVNTQGTFTYSLTTANITAIGQGSGKSITASQTSNGNTGTSPGFSFTVDTIPPTVTITSIGGIDSIVSGAAGDNAVVGTAEPGGSAVTITFESTVLGNISVDAQGNFSYSLSASDISTIGQGEGKVITASQTDAVGNIGTSAPFTFTVNTIAPVVTIDGTPNDNIIFSTQRLLFGTGDAANGDVTITFGNTVIGTATFNSLIPNTWSYSFTDANITTIGQGTGKSITASQTDAVGNTGTSAPFILAVDTIPPTVTITSVGGSDSVVTSAAGDNIVVGTAEPGGTGVSIWFGNIYLGFTSIDTQGNFSYNLTPANIATIGQGSSKSITASQSDSREYIGNIGTSAPFTFTVNTIAPVVTITSIGGSDSVVTSAAGDNTVIGTAQLGSNQVSIRFGANTLLGNAPVDAQGNFSYTLTTANLAAIGEGSGKNITAFQYNDAGLLGTSNPFTFTNTVNLVADTPSAPTVPIVGKAGYYMGRPIRDPNVSQANATIESLRYSSETITILSATLSDTRYGSSVYSNQSTAKICGGGQFDTPSFLYPDNLITIDKLDYNSQSCTRLGVTFLRNNRGIGGMGTALYGITISSNYVTIYNHSNDTITTLSNYEEYLGGDSGKNGLSSKSNGYVWTRINFNREPGNLIDNRIIKISYSTNTLTPSFLGVSAVHPHYNHAEGNSKINGYIIGGRTSNSEISRDITRFNFSTETQTLISTKLSRVIEYGNATGSSMAAYVGGGRSYSNVNPVLWETIHQIEKLTYSSEATSIIGTEIAGRSLEYLPSRIVSTDYNPSWSY